MLNEREYRSIFGKCRDRAETATRQFAHLVCQKLNKDTLSFCSLLPPVVSSFLISVVLRAVRFFFRPQMAGKNNFFQTCFLGGERTGENSATLAAGTESETKLRRINSILEMRGDDFHKKHIAGTVRDDKVWWYVMYAEGFRINHRAIPYQWMLTVRMAMRWADRLTTRGRHRLGVKWK